MARNPRPVSKWSISTITNRFVQVAQVQGLKAKDFSQEDKIRILTEIFDNPEKRASQQKAFKALKDSKTFKKAEKVDSHKEIKDAFKNLYKAIELHAPALGEEIIETVKSEISGLSQKAESTLQDIKYKTLKEAEEQVKRAQEKLEELKKKYNM